MRTARWMARCVLAASWVWTAIAAAAEPVQPARRGLFGSLSSSSSPSASVDPLRNLERALLFRPVKHPQGDWNPKGLAWEDASFRASDGTRLHGWYCPAARPRAVVLFCHGNGGNVTYWAWLLRELQSGVGVTTLAFDYRGYGRSEGAPSETGLYADARAARRWLVRRAQVDPREVVLMGQSLGGAVAVELAATDGARALILESTFSSAPAAAEQHLASASPTRLMRDRFDSAAKIGAYRGPLLQSHGDRDGVIAPAIGKRLFDAANQPKEFLKLRGHDHNDSLPRGYYQALSDFLARLPAPPLREEEPQR